MQIFFDLVLCRDEIIFRPFHRKHHKWPFVFATQHVQGRQRKREVVHVRKLEDIALKTANVERRSEAISRSHARTGYVTNLVSFSHIKLLQLNLL